MLLESPVSILKLLRAVTYPGGRGPPPSPAFRSFDCFSGSAGSAQGCVYRAGDAPGPRKPGREREARAPAVPGPAPWGESRRLGPAPPAAAPGRWAGPSTASPWVLLTSAVLPVALCRTFPTWSLRSEFGRVQGLAAAARDGSPPESTEGGRQGCGGPQAVPLPQAGVAGACRLSVRSGQGWRADSVP